MLASLAVRDFRYLLFGTAAGHLGFWVGVVAQSWLAYQLTGSATFLGLVSATSALPGLVLMLVGGVMADRWDRRAMLLYSNGTMALTALALTAIVATGVIQPWHLLILVFVLASAGAMNMPARQSLGPQLVGPPLISNAVALNSVSFNLTRLLGPAVAGILMAVVGPVGCFLVQAVWMVLAVLLTMALPADTGRRAAAQARSVGQNFLDGMRHVRDEPVVRGTVVIALVQNLFGMVYTQLLPVFAGSVLMRLDQPEEPIGGAGLGVLMSALGIGSTVGSFAAAVLSTNSRKGAIMFATSLATSLAIVAFAATSSVHLALAALAVLGSLQAVAQIMNQTILNLATPDEFRGRSMSVFMVTWSTPLLAALPAGWATDHVGAPLTVGATGVLGIAALAAAAVLLPAVRGFRDANYVGGRQVEAEPLRILA
jgi:MFS family permease